MFCRKNIYGIIAVAVAVGLLLSLFFGGFGTFLIAVIVAVIGIVLIKSK